MTIVCIDITWVGRVTVDRRREQPGCYFVAFYDKTHSQTSITAMSLRHKCPKSPASWLFCQQLLKTPKLCISGLLWGKSARDRWILIQRPVLRKAFPYYDIIMGISQKKGLLEDCFVFRWQKGMFLLLISIQKYVNLNWLHGIFKFPNDINNFVNTIQVVFRSLVPSGNKPLPEPKIYVAIWHD